MAAIARKRIECPACGNMLGEDRDWHQYSKHKAREFVGLVFQLRCDRCGAWWTNPNLSKLLYEAVERTAQEIALLPPAPKGVAV